MLLYFIKNNDLQKVSVCFCFVLERCVIVQKQIRFGVDFGYFEKLLTAYKTLGTKKSKQNSVFAVFGVVLNLQSVIHT